MNALASIERGRYHDLVSVTPDLESPADVVTAWREMVASHAAVSDFEVLDRLAECSEGKCRAQELAESVHLSQSALSRLVDRLAKNGLVERCACDMDRRGIYAVLTAEGQRRHDEAAVTHREILARLLPAR
jgi:DNA-binding MarR family transcriptional regulator